MARLECPQCRYSREFSEREEEFGMLCPKCHCAHLRRPLRARRGRMEPGVRPLTVRTLIGAGVGFLVAPPLLVVGYQNLSGRGGLVFARLFAAGVLILGCSFLGLIVGLFSLFRDLGKYD